MILKTVATCVGQESSIILRLPSIHDNISFEIVQQQRVEAGHHDNRDRVTSPKEMRQ